MSDSANMRNARLDRWRPVFLIATGVILWGWPGALGYPQPRWEGTNDD